MKIKAKNVIKRLVGKRIPQIYRWIVTIAKVHIVYCGLLIKGRYRKQKDKTYPTTIQLPITYKCNFDCVMCGMHKLIHQPGFTPEELGTILKDNLYKDINSVGVNGGEPFLLKDIDEYIKVLFQSLPKLKHLYIISNGYLTSAILEKSQQILDTCHKHSAQFGLSISLDGYGQMQDRMRGRKGAFEHAMATCQEILRDRSRYCDSFGTICTVTKINVYNLAEIDVFAAQHGIPINYNVATIHKRISNEDKYEDFSVFTDEHARLMAAEFFYERFLKTKKEQYYGLYYMVSKGERLYSCGSKRNVVTLTPDGNLSYCATHSDIIGSALTDSSEKVFFNEKNLAYRKKMQAEYCKSCSHYSDRMERKNYFPKYVKERMREVAVF